MRELSGISFKRALIPIKTLSPPKGSPSYYHFWGLGFQNRNFGGTQMFSPLSSKFGSFWVGSGLDFNLLVTVLSSFEKPPSKPFVHLNSWVVVFRLHFFEFSIFRKIEWRVQRFPTDLLISPHFPHYFATIVN